MFQNKQKVVVVSSGDPARVIKVQSASGTPDPSRYPIVDTTGVSGRDQSVQIVSGGDPTRFPILRGVSDARGTADSVITALTPAAWYRNATGVTSAGGFASQWDDYSGNTRHLVQATGTNQPAYAGGILSLDGADNFMATADFAFAQPLTLFFVMYQDTWTAGDIVFDGNSNLQMFAQAVASPNLQAFAGISVLNTNPDLALQTWGIIAIVFNGASSSIRLNNNAKVTANAGANNPTRITIGKNGGVAASYFDGSFKEIVAFDSALSDANQDAVITALNNALTVF